MVGFIGMQLSNLIGTVMGLPDNYPLAPGDRCRIVELQTAQQLTHQNYLNETGMLVNVGLDGISQIARMRMDMDGGMIDVRPRQLDFES